MIDYRYFNKGLLNLIKSEGIDDVIFFHNVFSANTLSHTQRQRIIKHAITDSGSKKEITKPKNEKTLNQNNSLRDSIN